MNKLLPVVFLVGHGETTWNLTGQFMGSRDLPLTERGERNALRLKERLRGLPFTKVLTSPQQRSARTCELAGFGGVRELDDDLNDWNFGLYEGRNTAEILREHPTWDLFHDGCPGGESPLQVGERATRVVHRLRRIGGNVLVFSSLDFLRVLATRWISAEIDPLSSRLALGAASLSGLGYENSASHPVIRFWNDEHHVGA